MHLPKKLLHKDCSQGVLFTVNPCRFGLAFKLLTGERIHC